MNLHPQVINVAATSINTEATIYTPASGKRFRILGGSLQCTVAGVAIFKDNTGGTTMFTLALPVANTPTGFTLTASNKTVGKLSAAADNVLTGQGINGNLSGWLEVIEE